MCESRHDEGAASTDGAVSFVLDGFAYAIVEFRLRLSGHATGAAQAMTGVKEIILRRKREFIFVGAVILFGTIGHVMWWFIGGIPEKGHPNYLVANVAFYLSLIELLGLGLLGLLLWSVWRDDQEKSILVSMASLTPFILLILVFLFFSRHPLGLTIFMLIFMLPGLA